MSVFVKQRGVSAARRPPRAALTRGSPRSAQFLGLFFPPFPSPPPTPPGCFPHSNLAAVKMEIYFFNLIFFFSLSLFLPLHRLPRFAEARNLSGFGNSGGISPTEGKGERWRSEGFLRGRTFNKLKSERRLRGRINAGKGRWESAHTCFATGENSDLNPAEAPQPASCRL